MRETQEDLDRLQTLLDESYATAGPHLREIITPERRLDSIQVVGALDGMCLLALATVTSKGRPLVAPVDGIFCRGSFWFGSSDASLRFAHIRARPQVSATYLPREALSVTVHGDAYEVSPGEPGFSDLEACCIEIYGDDWKNWAGSAPYARIDATKMFTFQVASENVSL
ncbi:MAG: pyridoxamine 5'-phosphate oxidase family protein [Acidimicrobiales bacterium]